MRQTFNNGLRVMYDILSYLGILDKFVNHVLPPRKSYCYIVALIKATVSAPTTTQRLELFHTSTCRIGHTIPQYNNNVPTGDGEKARSALGPLGAMGTRGLGDCFISSACFQACALYLHSSCPLYA